MLINYIYWWEENYEGGLEDLHNKFLKESNLYLLYITTLNDSLSENHLKHCDRERIKTGNQKLDYFEETLDNQLMKRIIIKNMDLLINAYESIKI